MAGERKGSVIYQKSSKHSPQEVEQSLREAAQLHKFTPPHGSGWWNGGARPSDFIGASAKDAHD
jgi:hypothetical protein